jgi:hypothetical protein
VQRIKAVLAAAEFHCRRSAASSKSRALTNAAERDGAGLRSTGPRWLVDNVAMKPRPIAVMTIPPQNGGAGMVVKVVNSLLRGGPQRADLAGYGFRFRSAIVRPSLHQPVALLEQVSTLVCALGFVAIDMRERRLGDFAREISALSGPITE